jgi:hypothetical protein
MLRHSSVCHPESVDTPAAGRRAAGEGSLWFSMRVLAAVTIVTAISASSAHATVDARIALRRVADERPSSSFLMPATPARADMSLQRPGGRDVDEFEADDRDKVNVTRAVALSLILPGAGQWYAGAKGRAAVFLAGEAATWTLYAYFRTVSGLKEDDYRLFARLHAGVDPSGKGDDFYRTITFYESRDQYNEAGRLLSSTRPYYPDEPYWDWQWDSEVSRGRYRTLRNQSSEATNRAKFSLGAAIVERLAAAVDAWRTAKSINRRARMEASLWKVRVYGRLSFENPRFLVMLSRQF